MAGQAPAFGQDMFGFPKAGYEIIPALALFMAGQQSSSGVNLEMTWAGNYSSRYMYQVGQMLDNTNREKIFIPYGYKFLQIIIGGFFNSTTAAGYRRFRVHAETYQGGSPQQFGLPDWSAPGLIGAHRFNLVSGWIPLDYTEMGDFGKVEERPPLHYLKLIAYQNSGGVMNVGDIWVQILLMK